MPPNAPFCTLADLLAETSLGLALATPGADLSRPVRWVQTTELVNPKPYLRSDELVCTVGSSLTTDAQIHTFVEALSGQAAGLCFGLGDVHESPPDSLVRACQREGLPLLTLPFGVAFLAVADVVEARRGRASDAASNGRLLELVQSGLARPESVHEVLAAHSLDPDRLVVACWPLGSVSALSGKLPGGVLAQMREHTVTVSGSVEAVALAAQETGLRCGYAGPARLTDLAAALSMATLAFAATPAGGKLLGPDELTSFARLLESAPRERLEPFVDRVIKPLVTAGERTRPNYVDTLRAFLDNDLSVGRTAKAQFLHPNTVRHRLALIKRITGRDPFVLDDVLTLAVAVRAHDQMMSESH